MNDDVKQTNKQREAIILKGISTSINAMAFPNFTNLLDMLACFDYYLMPTNIGDMELNDIFAHYHHLPIPKSSYSLDTNIVKDISVLQKTYMFLLIAIAPEFDELQTQLSLLDNNKPVKITISSKKTFESINMLANHPRIGVTSLPLGKHDGKIFSATQFEYYDSINDILKIITKTNSDVLIYRFCVIEIVSEFETFTKYAIRYCRCDKK